MNNIRMIWQLSIGQMRDVLVGLKFSWQPYRVKVSFTCIYSLDGFIVPDDKSISEGSFTDDESVFYLKTTNLLDKQ